MKVETIYTPSDIQFKNLTNYIRNEYGTGNLSTIIDSFEKNELITLFKGTELIGYSAYEINNPISKINLFGILEEYKNTGLGKRLFESTLKEIENKKGEIIELECSPPSSEPFWKKMKFINLPETRFSNGKVLMYKTIINKLLPNQKKEEKNIIQLWDVEPHLADRTKPKWVWEISSTKLKTPIIQPIDSDWQICWKKGDIEIKKSKVKYFGKEQICFGHFLIIRDLKSIKH